MFNDSDETYTLTPRQIINIARDLSKKRPDHTHLHFFEDFEIVGVLARWSRCNPDGTLSVTGDHWASMVMFLMFTGMCRVSDADKPGMPKIRMFWDEKKGVPYISEIE